MGEDAWKKFFQLIELEIDGKQEKAEKMVDEMKQESEVLWTE